MSKYLLLLSLYSLQLFSQNYIVIEDDFSEINATPNALYLEDKTTNLTINDVLEESYKYQFTINKESVLNFGRTPSAYWIKLSLDSYINSSLFLEQEKYYINYLDLYLVQNDSILLHKKHGSLIPFTDRDVRHKNLVFKLDVKKGEQTFVYLRYLTAQTMEISLSVQSLETFTTRNRDEQMIFGLFNGMLLIVIVFNVFMAYSFRDNAYLFYIGFIIALGLYFGTLNGITFEYLWPSSPTFNFWATSILSAISGVFLMLFTRSILEIKRHSTVLDKSLLIIAGLNVFFLFSPVVFDPTIVKKLLSLSTLSLTLIAVLFSGFYSALKKYRPAYYFLLAWFLFIAGAVLMMLRAQQILPSNFITQYGVQIGAAIQMVLLSLALSDRISMIQEERELALENQINESKKLVELSSTFKKFVPSKFIELLGKPVITDIELGDSAERELTIMFTDIRAFSRLSSQMTPSESFQFLNEYLEKMEPIIEKNNGFIDKYIGDSIMALFETPEDAVKAGVQMLSVLKDDNVKRIVKKQTPVEIGIGINTGKLMLGTIGSKNRLQGTVISDSVNTAYRIEQLTKRYNTALLISEESFNKLSLSTPLETRLIDQVNMDGKAEITTIYEVYDFDIPQVKSHKKSTKPLFEEAVIYFQKKNYLKAFELFSECESGNSLDKVVTYYIDRCQKHFNEID